MSFYLSYNNLHIPAKADSPEISANSDTNAVSITGRSYPEDAISFYQQLHFFIQQQLKAFSIIPFFLELRLEYFNTSSGKQLIDLLTEIKKFPTYHIKFYYHPQDEDMLETAKELSEIAEVEIEFLEWNT